VLLFDEEDETSRSNKKARVVENSGVEGGGAYEARIYTLILNTLK